MSAGDGNLSIEPVLQLICDGREGEVLSAIALGSGPSTAEELHFSTTAAPRDGEEIEDAGRRDRVRLVNLYRLSVFLMDKAMWDKAATALGWTIKVSGDSEEDFLLEESRFRKALCHKMLGQQTELMKEKEAVSADETFFIGDKVLGVGDL